MIPDKKNIFVLIIFVFSTSALFAQEYLQKQFKYAVTLYGEEQYFDAITEFKRLLFFDSTSNFKYEANEFIGKSYKQGAKFSDAILYFTIAEMSARNNDELFESKLQIIRCNILRRTTPHALELLDSLEKDKRFSSRQKEVFYWKGWTYIFADEWNKASEEFSMTDTNLTLSNFCDSVHKEKYSVVFADIISHFIPGAGQIYTGHYFSGLLSLGWNILWGYVTVNAFDAGRIFDGVVVGNFLWLRFYNGNLQNSKKFAVEENLKITNRALNYLQFTYKGLKP